MIRYLLPLIFVVANIGYADIPPPSIDGPPIGEPGFGYEELPIPEFEFHELDTAPVEEDTFSTQVQDIPSEASNIQEESTETIKKLPVEPDVSTIVTVEQPNDHFVEPNKKVLENDTLRKAWYSFLLNVFNFK